MRAALAAAAILLSGCEALGVYWHETAGISPLELLPLVGQEKQYVEDRELESRIRSALAAQGMKALEVDVYLKEVTLQGDERAVAVAKAVRGVKSVKAR